MLEKAWMVPDWNLKRMVGAVEGTASAKTLRWRVSGGLQDNEAGVMGHVIWGLAGYCKILTESHGTPVWF